MQITIISYYHSGVCKRRARDSIEGAHRLAAWEVDAEGAYKAEILRAGAVIGTYAWRGALTFIDGV